MKSSARLTIDMTKEAHYFLKMVSIILNMPMKDFVLYAVFDKIANEKFPENEYLPPHMEETLKNILYELESKRNIGKGTV